MQEGDQGPAATGLLLRQAFLWLFLGFLALTALVAMVTVLSGTFGQTEGRILGSSATVSAASVCAMACAAFRERDRGRRLGSLGIGLAIAAAAALLVQIWRQGENETQVKVTLLLVTYAAGMAHAELLWMPRLLPAHRWVQKAAVAAIATLDALLTYLILGGGGDDAVARLAIAVSIVVALLTLVVPILWKIGGASRAVPGDPARLSLSRQADGAWVDGAGVRYEVRRLEDAAR